MNRQDDFEAMVHNIQSRITQREEQTYSPTVISHYRNPTHFRPLTNPTHTGCLKGSCGDTMQLELIVTEERIQDAGFWTDGCGASIATADMLCSLLLHKTLEQAQRITPTDLCYALDGLPPEHEHCSVLAINTLYACLHPSDS